MYIYIYIRPPHPPLPLYFWKWNVSRLIYDYSVCLQLILYVFNIYMFTFDLGVFLIIAPEKGQGAKPPAPAAQSPAQRLSAAGAGGDSNQQVCSLRSQTTDP